MNRASEKFVHNLEHKTIPSRKLEYELYISSRHTNFKLNWCSFCDSIRTTDIFTGRTCFCVTVSVTADMINLHLGTMLLPSLQLQRFSLSLSHHVGELLPSVLCLLVRMSQVLYDEKELLRLTSLQSGWRAKFPDNLLELMCVFIIWSGLIPKWHNWDCH